MIQRFFLLLVATSSLTSCSQSLEPTEYVAWVENYANSLHVNQEHGEYVFDLQYKPVEYVALQQNRDLDQEELKTTIQSNEGMEYFTLSIGLRDKKTDFLNQGVSNIQEKQRKIYHYAYQFQEEIFLEVDGQKLPCVLFHFERSADIKNSRTFVLGFENLNKNAVSIKMVIDSQLLSSSPVEIEISKEKIPTLKL